MELEKDEFYTLEELDELDQSMTYLARKFSNIRVRKPRYFKSHFATECRKPKKAKKDKAYLELEAKEKLEKSEVKLKSFKNASELVGQYHEKNKPCANIDIGLDYDAFNIKKKNTGDRGKATMNKNVPAMLRNVGSTVFKTCEVNFSEEELIIKQEIADEDNDKKNVSSIQSSKAEENRMDNQSAKTPVKETKIEDARKKKKNRNGRMGINKTNNLAYVADVPGKKCRKCGSTNHLTYPYKRGVSKPTEGACKYNEADLNDPYSFYDKFDCIPCNLKLMKSCHKLRVDLKESKIESTSERDSAQQSLNSILS
ncbi:hypothetical protein AgCh_009913 [Apium graveolens]